ncbi:MAG TPA: PaaI family thioesterase [Spirochaetota bacterium]|nr:PaaI family thioesterase [Spirochaetota bacterium]
MTAKAFQDYYPDDYAHCYGCGRLNEKGMHIKSYWDGDESFCRFTPALYQSGGFPGNIYGGLIASLIDCHCAGTAAAARLREDGFMPGERPLSRFVTASLKVDYIKPTPAGIELEIRARVMEIKNRKVVLSATVIADGIVTAKGEAVMVQLPENLEKRI